MVVDMEKILKARINRSDLREKVLQSLGFDLETEETKEIEISNISSDELDDSNDICFLSDYEKLNFIPNDDSIEHDNVNYDPILNKYKNDPYALIVYYLEMYPDIKQSFTLHLYHLLNDRYGIIINIDNINGLSKYLHSLFRNLNNVLIAVLYATAKAIVENIDSIVVPADKKSEINSMLIDSYFDITEDNNISIKLAYITQLTMRNFDLFDITSKLDVLDMIKSNYRKYVIYSFINTNTTSVIINFIKDTQEISNTDILLELFSFIKQEYIKLNKKAE